MASDAFKKAQEAAIENLATKDDIKDLKHEMALLKWMMGFMLAGILSLVLKAFFA